MNCIILLFSHKLIFYGIAKNFVQESELKIETFFNSFS